MASAASRLILSPVGSMRYLFSCQAVLGIICATYQSIMIASRDCLDWRCCAAHRSNISNSSKPYYQDKFHCHVHWTEKFICAHICERGWLSKHAQKYRHRGCFWALPKLACHPCLLTPRFPSQLDPPRLAKLFLGWAGPKHARSPPFHVRVEMGSLPKLQGRFHPHGICTTAKEFQ